MKLTRILTVLGVGLGFWAPAVHAETTLCTAIAALPRTISAAGSYCLTTNLTTAATLTAGSAITIAADNVQLDLNGFKLESGATAATLTTTGITAVNRRGISIRNGTVRGFYRGVSLQGGANSAELTVEGLLVTGSKQAGIWAEGSGAVLRHNRVLDTTGTTAVPDSDTFGIRADGAGARISGNDVSGTVGMGDGVGHAIYVAGGDGTVIEGNRVGNAAPGASVAIDLASGADVLVLGNSMTALGSGLVFGGAGGKYRDNLTSGVTVPFSGGVDAGNNQ